ncbi:MAG: ankyrin repeat domain-containing protein, partial [Candidatus Eremiobacteraeota bacterium]|nr:ankyrin repeat domain-containing protein [Candidatus Eremiobacteraeota bacterium]
PESVLITALAALVCARILTAVVDREVFLRLVPTLAAGAAGCFMTWFLVQLYFLIRYWSGFGAISRPVEWLKVVSILEPLRFVEILVFSGGVAALCTFLVREKLAARPWISGRLHSSSGKKMWRAGAAVMALLFLVSALSAPSDEGRREPGKHYYPLAQAMEMSIYREDKATVNKILERYPSALDWYLGEEKVINSVRSLGMARYLVEEKGVDLAPSQGRFETALYRAVKARNDPLAEYLLDHGADPNEGRYLPLVEAVKQRRPYAIHFLLEHGARSDAPSLGDGTALEVAEKMARDDIWLILQQKR